MHVQFNHCGQLQKVALIGSSRPRGRLHCPKCGELVTQIDVTGCQTWIDQQVEHKRRLAQAGRLGTRKQTTKRTDEEIDRDGLAAELALCAIFSPGAFRSWKKATELGGNN